MSTSPRPDRAEPVEVLRQRPVLVVADERPDGVDAEPCGRVDHLPQVAVDLLPVGIVRVQVVRVVRERGYLEAMPVEDVAHLAGVEVVHVDVRDARVAALLAAARRPAGDLERLEPFGLRPRGHLLEGQVWKRSRQEAQLHAAD